jgi:hypothetical protein
MFERVRFVRYALRFERAYKDDHWEPVTACFHPDGAYIIHGGSEYDGEYRGRAAIAGIFKRMLDGLDRRFDSRKPGLTKFPRMKRGVLELGWKARYTKGTQSQVLSGTSLCTFKDGKLFELRDTANADEWRALLALLG